MKLQRQTSRLVLRSAVPDDLEAWQRVLAQPSTAPYAYQFSGISPEHLRINFQLRQDYEIDSFWLSIFEKETQVFVGFCGLSGKGDKVYDAFYYLADAFQGKGYATEVLNEMIRFALTTKGRQMVIARIGADNLKSQAVAIRSGMISIRPKGESEPAKEQMYFYTPGTLPLDRVGDLLMDAAVQEQRQKLERQAFRPTSVNAFFFKPNVGA